MSKIEKEPAKTWRQLYEEAVAEPDLMKGLERIARAREAIRTWLEEFNHVKETPEQKNGQGKKSA
jgi:hypothetical protein